MSVIDCDGWFLGAFVEVKFVCGDSHVEGSRLSKLAYVFSVLLANLHWGALRGSTIGYGLSGLTRRDWDVLICL